MAVPGVRSYDGLIKLEAWAETSDDLIQLLREDGLIRSTGKRCCLRRRMTVGAYGKDANFGKVWRCNVCKKTESFLVGSFFGSTHLRPFVILKMAYAYVHLRLNANKIQFVMEGSPGIAVITGWLKHFRSIMSKDVVRETAEKMGGPGKLVVVDETVMGQGNHAKSQPADGEMHLVLGIYDVEKKEGILEFVRNLSSDEVLPRVLSKVETGSVIHTKERDAYAALSDHGYVHRSVSYRKTFKASDGTHLNHIKGYFSRVKTYLRKRNVTQLKLIPSYLEEFMWMERHREAPWKDFIIAIRRQYRV